MALKQSEKLIGETLNTISFTKAPAVAGDYTTPLVVPSSETNYTYSYTIQSSDMPTTSHPSAKYSVLAYTSLFGDNIGGSTQTLSYSFFKNGSPVSTGSFSVTATHRWGMTLTHEAFLNVQVGDVFQVNVWATSDTYFNVKKHYFSIVIGHVQICDKLSTQLHTMKYVFPYPSDLPTGCTMFARMGGYYASSIDNIVQGWTSADWSTDPLYLIGSIPSISGYNAGYHWGLTFSGIMSVYTSSHASQYNYRGVRFVQQIDFIKRL